MKNITKKIFLILFILCLSISTAYSFENNIQKVGWGIDEIEGYDGGDNPLIPENIEIENDESASDNTQTPKDPIIEYDPNNPYGEWEN